MPKKKKSTLFWWLLGAGAVGLLVLSSKKAKTHPGEESKGTIGDLFGFVKDYLGKLDLKLTGIPPCADPRVQPIVNAITTGKYNGRTFTNTPDNQARVYDAALTAWKVGCRPTGDAISKWAWSNWELIVDEQLEPGVLND